MTATDHALAKITRPTQGHTIFELVERQKPAIEKALGAAIGVERFTRIIQTELRRNIALGNCSPESVLGAMMLCAQLGLEPGPLGHAYLVPFKRECTFVLGYTGIVALAYRSGELKSIVAQPVYDAEPFKTQGGSAAKIVHEMLPPDERGANVTAYYALAKLKSGGEVWKVLYPAEIEAHRKRSPAGKSNTGPWATDYLPMALKTAVKVLRPWLPLSAVFGRGVEVDEQAVTWEDDGVVAADQGEDTEAAEGKAA